jgi:hypothetical protein
MCHFEYTNFVQSAVQGLGPGMVGLHLRGKTAQAQRQPMLRVEVAVQWFVVCSFCLTLKFSGAHKACPKRGAGQRPLERTVRPVHEAEGKNLALTFKPLHEANP